ncbi:MAG: CapA family protein [Bacteroidales bacterium]|nr:CapA family protein [Bacteroidales bacterium]
MKHAHLTSLLCLLLIVVNGCNQLNTTQTTNKNKQEETSEPIITTSSDTISIVLTGDVMIGINYPDTLIPVDSGRQLFKSVTPWLSNADLTIGNLEGIISNIGQPKKRCNDTANCHLFRMPEELAIILSDAGYDVLSLANNHARDFGDSAIQQTINVLQEFDIVCVGQRGHCREAIVERNGYKIGILAFSPHAGSMNLLDIPTATKRVSELKSRCDIVVVSMHGGAEGADYLHTPQEEETFLDEERGCVYCFAHAAIDAGADLVFGHGPHVPRAVEVYKQRFIAYSLGNFCTPFKVSTKGYAGYAPIIRVTLTSNGTLVTAKVYSAIQHVQTGPRIDPEQHVAHLIQQLTEEDFPNQPITIDTNNNVLTIKIK